MAVRELGNAAGNPLGRPRSYSTDGQLSIALKTTAKKGDAVFFNSDGSNQFIARRAIAPMSLVSSAVYGNGMSTGGFNPDDTARRGFSLCVLQNGYTVFAFLGATSSSSANGYPFVQIYDVDGKLVTTINVTGSTILCSHVTVCVSGDNTFTIFYYDGASGSGQAFYYKRYDFNGNTIGSQVQMFAEGFSNCGGLSAEWNPSINRLLVCVSVTNKTQIRWYIFDDNSSQLYSGTINTVSSSLRVAAIPSLSRFIIVYSASSGNYQFLLQNSNGGTVLTGSISSTLLDTNRDIDLVSLSNGGFAVFGGHNTSAKSLLLYDSSGTNYYQETISGEKGATQAIESNQWGFTIAYNISQQYSQPLVAKTYLNNGTVVSTSFNRISDTHTNGIATIASCSYSNGEILFWYADSTESAVQYAYFAPAPSNETYSLAGFATKNGIAGETINAINPFV